MSHSEFSEELIEKMHEVAKESAANADCVFSKFPVGAAMLCQDGSIVGGCNVENVSFGAGCCAERTALHTAICAGKVKRGEKPFKLCVVDFPKLEFASSPCGICRQALGDFCNAESTVISFGTSGDRMVWTVKQLLPDAFEFDA
eukprot:TRINITY_DN778066_c0_g1_i1.p1 TRINITY_DN778066_c0_g1~~TRINITY_DN778066_c0_g1_i1.p1  ORF type:complete len:144 (+),score=35.99 TRINITY_DN778066_c0_g1_i1:228-659(+)